MDAQRILILSTESLLSDSIRHLLDGEPEINIIGVVPLLPAPLDTISRLEPDVIIIVDPDPPTDSASTLGTLLEAFTDLPLLRIGLREPSVRTYQSRQEPATSFTLKQALRHLTHLHSTT